MGRSRSDFWFKLEPVASYSAMVAGLSTLRPLSGRYRWKHLEHVLLKNVQRWRMRLLSLRAAGWQAIDNERFAYARNCRPCAAHVSPVAKACHLRVCPFCHARRVESIFLAVQQRVAEYREAGQLVTVASFTRTFITESFVPDDAIGETLCQQIIPLQLERRALFRQKGLRGNKGDCHWITIEPLTNDAQTTGAWRIRHGNLAILPGRWTPQHDFPGMRVCVSPNGRTLAKLTARAFIYPRMWMYGNEELLATMLNVTTGVRFLTRTGKFRGLHEQES